MLEADERDLNQRKAELSAISRSKWATQAGITEATPNTKSMSFI